MTAGPTAYAREAARQAMEDAYREVMAPVAKRESDRLIDAIYGDQRAGNLPPIWGGTGHRVRSSKRKT